ncbi:MAG: hypothetical protein HYR94_12220 [Chloroflexi bacterium]|nr:hypothetical protein [Chloroflexota bacterium]
MSLLYQASVNQSLMLLLARSGQRSAALAQYETCRRLLARSWGSSRCRKPPSCTSAFARWRLNASTTCRFRPPPLLAASVNWPS